MIFYTYSNKQFAKNSLKLSPPTKSQSVINKPRDGKLLWASSQRPDGTFEGDTYWHEYASVDGSAGAYRYQVAVNMSSILQVHTPEDYFEIPHRFWLVESPEMTKPRHYLNWVAIAKEYGGFYISAQVADALHWMYATRPRGYEDLSAWDTEQIVVWSHVVATVTAAWRVDPYEELWSYKGAPA